MSDYHAIFDYETLGQDVQKCPVLDLSYVVFDWSRFSSDKPYTFSELVSQIHHVKFDVEHQVKTYGYKIEKSTVEWWSAQGEAARNKIKPLPDDEDFDSAYEKVVSYFESFKVNKWWTRSNTYDPALMWRDCRNIGLVQRLDKALKFWNVRDTRTFIDAKTNFSLKENGFIPISDEKKWNSMFEKHNSIHDVAADILRLQTLVRLEKDLEIIE